METIRECTPEDFETMFEIINESALAYKNVIPPDRWHEPYMPREELAGEIEAGVVFWAFVRDERMIGIMGLQDKGAVALIRHAYVRTSAQGRGVGSKLVAYLMKLTAKPVLVGTWADANWAVTFYEKNGFSLVTPEEKDRLLRTYWNIPARQVDTSVVLAGGEPGVF